MSITASDVHAQTNDLRAQLTTPPDRIELGRQQIAAIEADQREVSGMADIGPLTQFQGMTVVRSKRDDCLKLLAANEDGEDAEVDQVEPVAPSGPDAPPAEAEPSAANG